MGFFSDEDIVYVGSSSSKLIDEYPNLITDAIIYAITNSGSIVDNILSAYRKNYSTKVDSLIRYAERTDPNNKYYFGMPTGTLTGFTSDTENLRNAIAKVEAVDRSKITILSEALGKPNPQGIVDAYLQGKYPEVYFPSVRDNKVILFTKGTQKYYYKSYTIYSVISPFVKPTDGASGIKINFAYYNEHFKNEVILTFDLGSVILGEWYTAYYLDPSDNTKTKVFVYNTSLTSPVFGVGSAYTTGTTTRLNCTGFFCIPPIVIKWYIPAKYPELKPPVSSAITKFYPVIPIRRAFTFVSTYNNKIETSVRKALGYLDLSLDVLEKALRENPDVKDISDAFINFRIPIFTQEEKSMEYLYNFYSWAAYNVGIDTTYKYGRETEDNKYRLKIEEDLMHYEWAYKSIVITTEEGVIGPIGTYSNSIEMEILKTLNPDYKECLYDEGMNCVEFFEEEFVIVKRQVSANTLIAIRVFSPTGQSNVTFEGSLYSALTSADIPVMDDLLNGLSTIEKSLVLLDATQMTVYAAKEETVKWYKKSFWSFVFQIAAIVIGIISLNPGAIYAAGAITVTQAASFIALFAGFSGLDLGVLGAVLTVVTVGATAYAGGFAGILSKTTGSLMNFAETLMKAVSAINDVMIENTKAEMKALMEDAEEFQEDYEARVEGMESATDALEDDFDFYDPMWSVGGDANEGEENGIFFDSTETPTQFYNRTIHTTNPGIGTLAEPSNFVDNMLRLPEFNYNDAIPAYRNPEAVYE